MADYRLQLFHFSDQEAAIPALDDAPRLSAVLNALRAQDIDGDGVAGFANTLTLSSGDAYIPGLFLDASADPSLAPLLGGTGRARADIRIQNELGVQAIAFGNHEFDLGTAVVAGAIAPSGTYPGAAFPYLSGNLNFAPDANLAPLVTADGQEASTIPGKITGSTVITVNGEQIGVVAATTPILRSISSPGNVEITPTPFGGSPSAAELDALAAIIQADVDALLVANPAMDKVILLAHMQQIAIEQALATRLRNVDIIVAGGSNTRLFDGDDRIRAGDSNQGVYPIIKTDADGKPIAVVNTDGNYKYVGRLVVDFDANGNIIPTSYNPTISGAYATDAQGVADLGAQGLVDPEIKAITDSLRNVINTLDGNFFGVTTEFLNGARNPGVRSEETNLGNLTADANLAIAQQYDSEVVISLKNGGGIRNSIGQIITPPGSTESIKAPPAGNDLVGKPEGAISQLDIQNALSFNNGLSLVTVTAEQLLSLMEHGVGAGQNQGRFPQVSGLAFSFDLTQPAGDRIQSLVIQNADGSVRDVVVDQGELVGDPSRSFRMVTLNFLAAGGDGYPFPTDPTVNRVDLTQPSTAPRTGAATFAADGSEQDAFAEYLAATFSTANPFTQADVGAALDTRIQNLAVRGDGTLAGTITGADGDDLLIGTRQADIMLARGGNDTVAGQQGNDVIFGGGGDDVLRGDRNSRKSGGTIGGDDLIYGGAGNDRIGGKGGNDRLFGEAGDDQIWGDDGDDLLWGGLGNDRLSGGKHNDIFILAANEGVDTILDYGNGNDVIRLLGLDLVSNGGSVSAVQNGTQADIFNGSDLLAIVQNTQVTNLVFDVVI